MAIKLKNKHLFDRLFLAAVHALEKHNLPMAVAWNIARINRKIKNAVNEINEFYISILKKYTELDEKGEFVPQKNDGGQVIPNTYTILEGKQEELEKALQEFMELELEIASFPVAMKDLGNINITPESLEKLMDTILVENLLH